MCSPSERTAALLVRDTLPLSLSLSRLQGYLGHEKRPPRKTVALCLGTYGDPRGVGLSLMSEVPLYAAPSRRRSTTARTLETLAPFDLL